VDGFKVLADYALGVRCRQQVIAEHLQSTSEGTCGQCDVCCDASAVAEHVLRARTQQDDSERARGKRRAEELSVALEPTQRDDVFAFVNALSKPVGRRYVMLALRGSRLKAIVRKGLAKNPHFGALKGIPEGAIYAALDSLLHEGLLVPKGQKYPTLWIAGKPVRPRSTDGTSPKARRAQRATTPLEAELRRFRRSEAKRRRVKPYQVFQDKTLKLLCEHKPTSKQALLEIWGIGEERIEKYGAKLLELCAI